MSAPAAGAPLAPDERLLQVVSRAERDAVMAPIEEAMTLPAAAYGDEAWYRLEVERVFARNWTAVAFACELPGNGDVRPFDLFDMPLLAVRGADGRARVFHNIVPYDGCLAVVSARQGLEQIATPYHGLRYDLRGRLLAAPYWDATPGCSREGLGGREGDLVEIASEERLGVLFVNLDGTAGDIDSRLAPWRRLVGGDFAIDRLVPARDGEGRPLIERRRVAANWKTYQENATINLLHEAFVHETYRRSPEVPRVGEDGRARFDLAMEGALLAFAHSRRDSGETYDPVRLPMAGHDIAVRPERGYFTTLYPNVNVPLLDAFAKVNIALPAGPGATELQHLRFYAPEALADAAFQEEERRVQGVFDLFHREDRLVIEAVQSARRSPVWRQHYYAPFWDALHHRFNQLVMVDMEHPAAPRDGAFAGGGLPPAEIARPPCGRPAANRIVSEEKP